MAFVEAFRQFQFRVGRDNFCSIHVSLVPQPNATGEHKTKPTQASLDRARVDSKQACHRSPIMADCSTLRWQSPTSELKGIIAIALFHDRSPSPLLSSLSSPTQGKAECTFSVFLPVRIW